MLRPIFFLSLAIILAQGCTPQPKIQPQAHKAANLNGTITTSKFADLFRESRNLNTSDTIRNYLRTAEQDPDNPETLYNLGYAHMQSASANKKPGEQALAIKYFTEVLSMVPGNQSVLNALYTIYYSDIFENSDPEAFTKAKAIYLQLSESARDKLNPPSLARFAQRLQWQEQQHQTNHQELRDMLLQATQENPHNDLSYIQLARLYTEDRYFALALATLKLGNESNPHSVDLLKAIARTYNKRAEVNGCNYEHKSDIVNAAKYYKFAIAFKPDDAALHFDLAQSFFDQNLYRLGLNETGIGQSITNQTQDIANLAQSYSMLGFNKQATQLIQQAVDAGYPLENTNYHEIFMNQGDWKNAAKGFDAYVHARSDFTVYDLIKSDIIAQQAQVQSWLDAKKVTTTSTWEEQLLNYWSLKITAEDLKKDAHTSCEKTEYYFYTGYRDYSAGHVAQANNKFTAALNENTYRFIERPMARYFLQKH